MLVYGLCRHGVSECLSRHDGCDEQQPIVDSIVWDDDRGDKFIASARCGIAAILSDMTNNMPDYVEPERYQVGNRGGSWFRSLFGIFPSSSTNPGNPLFVNSSGEAIRYDRPINELSRGRRSPTRYSLFPSNIDCRKITHSSAQSCSVAIFCFPVDCGSVIYILSDIHMNPAKTLGRIQVPHKITSISLSNDGRSLAYGTDTGHVYLNTSMKVRPENFSAIPQKLKGSIRSISWSSCNCVFGFCSDESHEILFHSPRGANPPPIPQSSAITMDVGSNLQRVAVRIRNGQIVVWERGRHWTIVTTIGDSAMPAAYPDSGVISLSPANDKVIGYQPGHNSVAVHSI